MCSKRCAKPVLPGTSCFEPTSYQRLTATTGRQVILGDDDAQAVGQSLVAEGDLGNGGGHAVTSRLSGGKAATDRRRRSYRLHPDFAVGSRRCADPERL